MAQRLSVDRTCLTEVRRSRQQCLRAQRPGSVVQHASGCIPPVLTPVRRWGEAAEQSFGELNPPPWRWQAANSEAEARRGAARLDLTTSGTRRDATGHLMRHGGRAHHSAPRANMGAPGS
jgi:hypothetical protein